MPDIYVADDKKKMEEKPQMKKEVKTPDLEELLKPKKSEMTRNPLAAFSFFPVHADFSNKDPEEKIILILRKHPITNFRWVMIAILMLLAPMVLRFIPLFDFLPVNFQLVGMMMWYLIVAAFVFEEFLGWFFNVYIITDERVFDVDFINLTYREVTDANIDQIQDVTVQVGSAIRTIFNYGHVLIQTAAEVPQIEFLDVPQPDRVARILRQLRVQEEQEKIEGRVR